MPLQVKRITPLILVFNMPRAIAFYRDGLGCEVIADSGRGDHSSWIMLRLDKCDLMLNDQYEPGREPSQPPPERTKWHRDTCLYFDCPDPDVAFDFLKSKGMDLKPPQIAPYGMKQLYVTDPDGYLLCFQSPVSST